MTKQQGSLPRFATAWGTCRRNHRTPRLESTAVRPQPVVQTAFNDDHHVALNFVYVEGWPPDWTTPPEDRDQAVRLVPRDLKESTLPSPMSRSSRTWLGCSANPLPDDIFLSYVGAFAPH